MRVLPHIKKLDDCFGDFLVRVTCTCGSSRHIEPEAPRIAGAGDEMVAHGFRSMASTCLNEQGWHPDLIELQLAHAERNESRGAYNRAQRLPERRRMMQAWAGYLDGLRAADPQLALTAA